jgi:hypothetical protein
MSVPRQSDTALFRETRNAGGSVERVRELISSGADVNRRHKYGQTPLWEAAYHGQTEIVAVLLAAGADPNIYGDDGSGPLYWAASNGHLAVVQRLLCGGADPNAIRDSGLSVLAGAISGGHADIVRRLLEDGAAVDHQYCGRSMPDYAEWCREPGIAAILRRPRRVTRAELGTEPGRERK